MANLVSAAGQFSLFHMQNSVVVAMTSKYCCYDYKNITMEIKCGH